MYGGELTQISTRTCRSSLVALGLNNGLDGLQGEAALLVVLVPVQPLLVELDHHLHGGSRGEKWKLWKGSSEQKEGGIEEQRRFD